MPNVRFDFHPQMTFRHREGETEGTYAKPHLPGPPPRVNVPRKSLEEMQALYDVVRKVREEDGVRAHNQILDLVSDPGMLHRQRYGEKEVSHGRQNRIAFAGATRMTKVGPCHGVNALAALEAIAAGVPGPKHLAGTPEKHVVGIHGDPRTGPVVEFDAWTVLPKVRVLSLEELAHMKHLDTFRLDPVQTRAVLSATPAPDPAGIARHEQELWGPVPPAYRFEAMVTNSIFHMAEKGQSLFWNRVYGHGDPRTRYQAEGDPIARAFDRAPVRYWEEAVQAPQRLLDARDQERLFAAGYLAEGSNGV